MSPRKLTRLAILAVVGVAASAYADAARAADWVGAWSASPTDAASSQPLDHQTLRMVVSPHLGGTSVRVRLSNRFGTEPVVVGPVAIARRAGGADVAAGTTWPVATTTTAPAVTVPPATTTTTAPAVTVPPTTTTAPTTTVPPPPTASIPAPTTPVPAALPTTPAPPRVLPAPLAAARVTLIARARQRRGRPLTLTLTATRTARVTLAGVVSARGRSVRTRTSVALRAGARRTVHLTLPRGARGRLRLTVTGLGPPVRRTVTLVT